jgi:hypothetical protein
VIPGTTPTKGRLLLATPPLEDPNFDRTVIYVLEHHDEGALGLVLNRPSLERLGEPLDGWVDLQTDPSLVFSGGPVETDALIALARTQGPLDEADDHLAPLNGDIASADLAADPALLLSSINASGPAPPARPPRLARRRPRRPQRQLTNLATLDEIGTRSVLFHQELGDSSAQTEMCLVLSLVNGERSQSLQRSRSRIPASLAMRSSSAGQT